MADRIRFHLDEHISHAVAKGLQQRGIDVTTPVGAGLRTLRDEVQMAYICQEQRVFVTNDAGFLARSARSEQHFGIVYYPPGTHSIGEVITFLVLMYEILTPEEMVNRVEYL